MILRKVLTMFAIVAVVTSCTTLTNKKTSKEKWGFDNFLLEAQKNTSRQRYVTAIQYLTEAQERFPDTDVITVNYLIGYNYYSLKSYAPAKKFLTTVFTLYQAEESDGKKVENEKFIVLAELLLNKITKEEGSFDPYHVKEDKEQAESKKPIVPRKE